MHVQAGNNIGIKMTEVWVDGVQLGAEVLGADLNHYFSSYERFSAVERDLRLLFVFVEIP